MNDILFGIIQAVSIAAITAICRYLIPTMIQYLRKHNYNFMADIVETLVRAAEQVTTEHGKGAEKFEMVFKAARIASEQYHISITDQQIEDLIESAVLTMNHELVVPA